MSKHVIGDKIRAKEQGFYRGNRVVIKYCPQIQVDGKFAMLSDNTTESGIEEYETREIAAHRI